jgi:hypothetical protein
MALEVSSSSEAMRVARAEAFERWIVAGAERFGAGGIGEPKARELTIAMLAALEGAFEGALEGAFVLARAQRDTTPVRVAGNSPPARSRPRSPGPSASQPGTWPPWSSGVSNPKTALRRTARASRAVRTSHSTLACGRLGR